MLNLFPEFLNTHPQDMNSNSNYLKGLKISLTALEQALDLWEQSACSDNPWAVNPNRIFIQRLAMDQLQENWRLN